MAARKLQYDILEGRQSPILLSRFSTVANFPLSESWFNISLGTSLTAPSIKIALYGAWLMYPSTTFPFIIAALLTFRFNRISDELSTNLLSVSIPITVSASSAVTASVGVLFDKGGVHASLSQTQQPQLQLRYSETYASASTQFITGSNLIIQSTTKGTTSDGSTTMNTFSTIAVSGSFDKQRELELVFVNQMTGSTSRAVFSDLEIT